MIGMAFGALHELADRELGAVVSWDQIFDSANRDNEFKDEQYGLRLGGPLVRAAEFVDAYQGSSEALLRDLVAKFREFAESPAGGVVKLISRAISTLTPNQIRSNP